MQVVDIAWTRLYLYESFLLCFFILFFKYLFYIFSANFILKFFHYFFLYNLHLNFYGDSEIALLENFKYSICLRNIIKKIIKR